MQVDNLQSSVPRRDSKISTTHAFAYSKLILIVDSSNYSARITSQLLKSWGYSTEIANSPTAALRMLHAGEVFPDMIFVEMFFHHENIFSFPKDVHSNPLWKKLPVVAHSVSTNKNIVMRAIQAGYCDYIVRPTQPDILREKIEKILSQSTSINSATFSVPISATGEALCNVQLTAMSEFGLQGLMTQPVEPHTVISLKSAFLKQFESENTLVRVIGCEKIAARRFKVAFTFVGLTPRSSTLIRRFLISQSRKLLESA